jgi:outer membrane receptor protein involved in Fe transport
MRILLFMVAAIGVAAELPEIPPLRTRITVTATRGSTEEVHAAAQVVNVHDRDSLTERPLPTLGNVLENSPGVLVQQSTYGQVSPFLRGLTGYHVLNLIDSVRFNNSTFRSGPNQYLAFVDPSQAHQVEAALGPAGAQYGSDALGGAIHVLTPEPDFGIGLRPRGEVFLHGASADRSGGASARFAIATPNLWWTAGGVARRHNDVRTGHGFDSRHVFRRFFGLDGELIRGLTGATMQDTGFTQHGVHSKVSGRLRGQQQLSFWYQQSGLENVRGYKDLWGGLGRLQSAFEPQSLRFLYARYEKTGLGPLDALSGTFSFNSQRDGMVRQGLRFSDPVRLDYADVDVYGYSTQGTTHIGGRQALVFGAELYQERVDATIYPRDARYRTAALFAQDSIDLVRNRLRLLAGTRWTQVRYRAPGIAPLTFPDLTFHTSLLWQANDPLAFSFIVSCGFRAPNLNDLGALGLNDLGYEIPSAQAIPAGALMGASAGEGALSTGQAVHELRPERLFNYEFGVRVKTSRFYARAHVYDAELLSPIVRRTLLFSAAAVPVALAGLPVTPIPPTPAQQAQGVVTVATQFDPRAVKAFVNDGHSRYYGLEAISEYVLTSRWRLHANYAILAGRDLNPNRPARRLPPQQGYASIRYAPPGARPWVEFGASVAGAQERLSGGDLDDERIGASRSRRDIADFFNGSLAAPFIDQRGVFLPTGETLPQIQQRVLPGVSSDTLRVPLYTQTAGWLALEIRGGVPLGERVSVNFALMNLLDRNYRIHGSGVDAPGANAWVGLRYRF